MIKYDLFGKINNSTAKVYIAPLTIMHTVVKRYYVNVLIGLSTESVRELHRSTQVFSAYLFHPCVNGGQYKHKVMWKETSGFKSCET